jgi:Na+/H+ antiporter NhaA
MNTISNVYMRAIPETLTNVHPLKTIALFCGIGFAASLCIASFGLDIGAGFF